MKLLIKWYWGNNTVCFIYSLELETLDGGVKVTVAGISVPSLSLLKNVSLFVKLASEVLKVVTADKNEYGDNNEKYVTRKRQGKLLVKL